MPTTKSAAKRLRAAHRRTIRNRAVKSQLKTYRKKLDAALAASDIEKSTALFREYTSLLDRAVKKGVIKRNNADRRKSRCARKVAALTTGYQNSTTASTTS